MPVGPPPRKKKPFAGPPQDQAGPPQDHGYDAPPPGPPQGPPPIMGPPPGLPQPGQGADPMQAMMGMLGPGMMAPPATPPAFPAGPDGMPFGASMPGMDDMDGDESLDLEGSPLLQGLLGGIGGGGGGQGPGGYDPYGQPPGMPDHVFDDGGTGDPGMGLEQLIMLLALAKMGVGGGPMNQAAGAPMAGASGAPDENAAPGLARGLGAY